jgi:cytochrome c oxidase subunit I+III
MVLAALMFKGPLEGRRFVDVTENSMYWYFIVASWLPLYALIYIAPRFL